jgi:cobalt-zinc-cadmium efflux system outer membrane protein
VERREQFGGLDTQMSIGVTVPLDLFRRGARVAVAGHAVNEATFLVDEGERVHGAMVREGAADLLAAVRQLEVVTRIAQASRERLELLTARVDAGAAPPLERDLADVEWRRSETDVMAWQGMADRALIALKALVGLSADTPLRLAAPLEAVAGTLVPAPGASLTDAIAARPDVQVADEVVARATAERTRAASEGKLDLSLTGGYMRRAAGVAPARERMNEVMFGVMVDLPWRNRQQGAIAAAEASRRAAEAEAAARRLDARAEIDAARVRDEAATRVVARYRDGLLVLADRNLAVVRESWQLGRGTLFDVIEEERRYLALQTDYTSALREAVDARTAVLRAWGAGQ